MIHGAKLINKNKYTRLSVLKNKKNQKKIFIKIEKRQRSGCTWKKGRRSIIALNNQNKHKTDVSHLY